MPLIRFRTGGLTVVQRLPDGSIRLPRGVIGRVDEMLKVKGVKLYPKELGPILASIPGLDSKQHRLIVSRTATGTDSLELRVVGEANAELKPLEVRFRAALGINMNSVRVVESLDGPMVTDLR
jgi:phenylacetate-CoA ligase